ncbi:MAG: hypothetical protein QOC71_1707 [Thermoplasmata archaeon]|jgi:hypothetical protein|nr:hypothetical protein [Thermoplasmata archaeon]
MPQPPASTSRGPVANGTATGYATGDTVFKAGSPNVVPATQPLLDIDKARKELMWTSMEQIERATALTWGARAVASYELVMADSLSLQGVQRFAEGDSYRSEAFEHASMADETGQVLRGIRGEVDAARAMALAILDTGAARGP